MSESGLRAECESYLSDARAEAAASEMMMKADFQEQINRSPYTRG